MIFEKLREIIDEHTQVTKDEIKDTSRFEEDLDMDSLDFVEMLMDVEDEFDINVPDNIAAELKTKTVGDLAEYVQSVM